MRFAVFGAGAAGCLLAGFLSDSGYEVGVVARGERLKAIRDHGIEVDSYIRKFTAHPAKVTDQPLALGTSDVVILAVKAWQVTEAARALQPLVGPGTCILPLENGVEATSRLDAVVGPGHALVGVGTFVSMMTSLYQVRHIADVHPTFRFGEADNKPSQRVSSLRDALMKSGFSVAIPPEIDVSTELWAKFAGVATNGGVGAVTRSPAGVWRTMPGSRQMRIDAGNEALDVARARGVRFPPSIVAELMAVLDEYPREMTASMQRDIMEGRPSELEDQVGAIVRLGRESGVPTPVSSFIYASLLPQELKARQATERGSPRSGVPRSGLQ